MLHAPPSCSWSLRVTFFFAARASFTTLAQPLFYHSAVKADVTPWWIS
jgi:hypothetical protein